MSTAVISNYVKLNVVLICTEFCRATIVKYFFPLCTIYNKQQNHFTVQIEYHKLKCKNKTEGKKEK